VSEVIRTVALASILETKVGITTASLGTLLDGHVIRPPVDSLQRAVIDVVGPA